MKRLFDIVVSGAGLIVFSPIALLIAIAIKLEDGGPVFFIQDRVGKDCRVFAAYKFRSMIVDAEKMTGPVQATANDPRMTRVGRVLRATAFDEPTLRTKPGNSRPRIPLLDVYRHRIAAFTIDR